MHRRDAFVPHNDRQTQHTHLPVNATPRPERYGPGVRESLWGSLDRTGAVVPPIEDEAHVNGRVPTTSAKLDRRAGVLYVSLDNAAYHSAGYEGFSRGERRFAQDMAEYAKRNGLTAIFMAHVPPTVGPKPGTHLPTRDERKNVLGWMGKMREDYPNSLWVHGHTHPAERR